MFVSFLGIYIHQLKNEITKYYLSTSRTLYRMIFENKILHSFMPVYLVKWTVDDLSWIFSMEVFFGVTERECFLCVLYVDLFYTLEFIFT